MRVRLRAILLATLLPLLFTPWLSQIPAPGVHAQVDTVDEIPPLPGSCGGVLDDPEDVVCCLNGYVFLDGIPVENAKVSIRIGDTTTTVWSAREPASRYPYYKLDPLIAQLGTTITIVAEYSGIRQEVSHTVLPGSQRVDIVLPLRDDQHYAAAGQIWQQGDEQRFAFPTGIAVDPQGKVYVSDWANHRIQVYGFQGNYLFAFGTRGNRNGALAGPMGIAIDHSGRIYVADSFNSRVQVFSATGSFIAAWGERGSAEGQLLLPSGIAVDDAGFVYVADALNHNLQKFTADGTHVQTWGGEGNTLGKLRSPVGVAIARDGRIYIADRDNHRIQILTPTSASGGQDQWDSFGVEGQGLGQLERPEGLALDGQGNVLVADWGNNRVQRFSPNGEYQTQWGSLGSGPTEFRGPRGIAVDTSSNRTRVYVVDNENQRVQRFSAEGNYQLTLGRQSNSGGQFWLPAGIALDEAGNVYITEQGGRTVQIFNASGVSVAAIGGTGSSGITFAAPAGVAIARAGPDTHTIYVADLGDVVSSTLGGVYRFDQDRSYLGRWGIERGIISASGLAVDQQGNLYIAEPVRSRIIKIAPDGKVLKEWPGANGGFDIPFGVAVDSQGFVYVADSGNNRIQKFTADGVFVSEWGSFGQANGQFNGPAGVAVDAQDNLYVTESGPLFVDADLNAHRVQKFTSEGNWIATWGEPGGADGQLVNPLGIAVAPNGDVLVADTRNNRVQRFRRLTYTRPIANIIQVTPSQPVPGDSIKLIGRAGVSVASRTIVAYRWVLSSQDGQERVVATSAEATLDTAGLEPGTYDLTLVAVDSAGEEGRSQRIVLPIANAGTAPWTMMLYLDADTSPNGSVEGSLARFLGESPPHGALYRLLTATSPSVPVVALYDGPGRDDTVLLSKLPGGELRREPRPEANMGDPQTLVEFVRMARQRAPALRYYLSIADHGGGLDGIAWDYTSDPRGQERLELPELRQALREITQGGQLPIDILHLDGCLTGLFEVAMETEQTVRVLISSQSLAWGVFAYEHYQLSLTANGTTPDIAKEIVGRYAELVGNRNLPYTISALDSAGLTATLTALDEFAKALNAYARHGQPEREELLSLREQTQVVDSNGDGSLDDKDTYVDIGNWTLIIGAQVQDATVRQAAQRLGDVFRAMMIEQRSGSGQYAGRPVNLDRTTGAAIYFPSRINAASFTRYITSFRVPQESTWDEYLVALLSLEQVDPSSPSPNPIPPLSPEPYRVYLPLTVR